MAKREIVFHAAIECAAYPDTPVSRALYVTTREVHEIEFLGDVRVCIQGKIGHMTYPEAMFLKRFRNQNEYWCYHFRIPAAEVLTTERV